ncbi:phage tail tip lysozyme [Dermacoccaceae bacterium W4C1]
MNTSFSSKRAAAVAALSVAALAGTGNMNSAHAIDAGSSRVQTEDGCVVELMWSNAKTAFTYFTDERGLTDKQAAGIIGNLIVESGVNPKQAQCGGGKGRGIAQWSVGDRWDTAPKANVKWYAANMNQAGNFQNLRTQLNFIWWELKTNPAWGKANLVKTDSVKDATTVFLKEYERAGTAHFDRRYEAAMEVYKKYA